MLLPGFIQLRDLYSTESVETTFHGPFSRKAPIIEAPPGPPVMVSNKLSNVNLETKIQQDLLKGFFHSLHASKRV